MNADTGRLITEIAGGLFMLLAVAVWSLLRGQQHAVSVRLWTGGALTLGAAFVLSGHRYDLPDWVSGFVVNGMAFGSQYLRILALRRHMALPLGLRASALCLLLFLAGLALCNLSADSRLRASFASVALGLATVSLAWHAHQVGRSSGSHSARMLAWSEWPLAVMLLVRAVSVWPMMSASMAKPAMAGLDWLLLLLAVVVAAIYSNLAYLGLLLDDTRQARAAEARARQAAEAQAEQLAVLLQQRDRLAQERQRTLDLLAHEIRQPLHDARGALQATEASLQALPAELSQRPQERLRRAQSVLNGVQSVLDNTLTAAALLARQSPLNLQELELQFLVDLALGDLDPDQRRCVQVDWQTDLRSAEVEPGLMRLALRNLLVNALRHGGPGVRVVLRVAEQDAPPALLLEVLDDGAGMPAARLAATVGAGASADEPSPGGGQGLRIVREVARRHGGQLQLANALPKGLRASVLLPLPA